MITEYQKICFTTDARHIAAADRLAKTLQISINKVFERALSGYIQRKERELNQELKLGVTHEFRTTGKGIGDGTGRN